MLKGNLLYGQSGGPTAVINASAVGLIKEAKKHQEIENIYAAHYGIEGIFKEDFIDLTNISEYKLNQIKDYAGAYFGSCRYKIKNDEDYEKILKVFEKHNIRYFFYNGGNDSMDTCNKISKYFAKVGYECRVVGIPKTIDNDLVCTDHTPGFGSSANYLNTTLKELIMDINSYEKGRVTIVEVMGRNAGWLVASGAYCKAKLQMPHLIYVPELPFVKEEFFEDVKKVYEENKKCVVLVSEGIKDKDGNLLMEGKLDAFGHGQLGGVGAYLAMLVEENLNLKTRAIELNLMQRCAAHLRSKQDEKEALEEGKVALELALSGKTDIMVINKTITLRPYRYRIDYVNLSEVANEVKELDSKYLTSRNGYINPNYVDYVKRFINK